MDNTAPSEVMKTPTRECVTEWIIKEIQTDLTILEDMWSNVGCLEADLHPILALLNSADCERPEEKPELDSNLEALRDKITMIGRRIQFIRARLIRATAAKEEKQ